MDLTREGLEPGQSGRQEHLIEMSNDPVLDHDSEGGLLGLEVLHEGPVPLASVPDGAPPPAG